MTDALMFASATPRFALPLLHTGQAQKEIFVNEALALADTLLHCAVAGESASPPENPVDDEAWLIGTGASGEWQGRDGEIAMRRGTAWAFVRPRDGMRVLDISAGCEMLFFGSWRKASLLVEPLGGSIVDGEARAAINDLIAALQALGILPSA
ncbi:DUF2793 domain-containing protein [Novosphingobium sp. P6W]|uniref:DUF2793 domain-containing protein n=1 Tax=Novosphingobium sp. P6W TaxID=1609758 RepID=UPI0005C32664|nr:DUF2793 domain-containing protein [Novosphingobium sp. P6W]AXB77834.1 DUF2793 domain-containing protein [Novosphingobium sp. P6W]KIS31104.1 hypothetical protein TQ38_19115 [Novosphingobium sp. P6W]